MIAIGGVHRSGPWVILVLQASLQRMFNINHQSSGRFVSCQDKDKGIRRSLGWQALV